MRRRLSAATFSKYHSLNNSHYLKDIIFIVRLNNFGYFLRYKDYNPFMSKNIQKQNIVIIIIILVCRVDIIIQLNFHFHIASFVAFVSNLRLHTAKLMIILL